MFRLFSGGAEGEVEKTTVFTGKGVGRCAKGKNRPNSMPSYAKADKTYPPMKKRIGKIWPMDLSVDAGAGKNSSE